MAELLEEISVPVQCVDPPATARRAVLLAAGASGL
jgi:hypothetical protein